MTKLCSICQQNFECNAENIAACECASLPPIGPIVAKKLAAFKDCICTKCLRKLIKDNESNTEATYKI